MTPAPLCPCRLAPVADIATHPDAHRAGLCVKCYEIAQWAKALAAQSKQTTK